MIIEKIRAGDMFRVEDKLNDYRERSIRVVDADDAWVLVQDTNTKVFYGIKYQEFAKHFKVKEVIRG